MVSRILALLALTLAFTNAANAQTFSPPPDVWRTWVAEGDSRTAAADRSYAGKIKAIDPNLAINVQAVGGSLMTDVQARISNVLAMKPRLVTLWIGANYWGGGDSVATIEAGLWAYTDALRASGIKVALMTEVSVCNGGAGASNVIAHNTKRAIVNADIRAAVGVHIDAVIDLAANALIGTDAASCTTTYWEADGIHLNDAGQVIVSSIALPVVVAQFRAMTPAFLSRPATYAAGTTPNVLGNGTDPDGGVPLAALRFPENFGDVNDAPWKDSDPGASLPAGYVVAYSPSGAEFVVPPASGTFQIKVRFQANCGIFANDDPLLFWGQPGVAHPHEFCGNKSPNAFITHYSLRKRCASLAYGGCANGTAYWRPQMQKKFGSDTYAIPNRVLGFYYVEDTVFPRPNNNLQPLVKRLRFIGGRNMFDPEDTGPKAEIAAANAQPGTSGRYQYLAGGMGNGIEGYQCVNSVDSTPRETSTPGLFAAPTLRKSNGTADADDWWYVGGVHTCVDGDQIETMTVAPQCWGGWDVSAFNGRDHMRYFVLDTVTGKPVCPNGWYRVPYFEGHGFYTTRGWDDYKLWDLSCQPMMTNKLIALGTPRTVLPGECLHDDWENGWAHAIINTWQNECFGIPDATKPHTCITGLISGTQRLIGNDLAPDGRNPQTGAVIVDSNDSTKLQRIGAPRQPKHVMKGM
jgi:hypothetical protein